MFFLKQIFNILYNSISIPGNLLASYRHVRGETPISYLHSYKLIDFFSHDHHGSRNFFLMAVKGSPKKTSFFSGHVH